MGDKFPPGFPDELVRTALVSERFFAWKFDDAIKVINWLSLAQIAVVDMDLYVEDAKSPVGCRQWALGASIEQEPNETWEAYIKRSAQAARIVIEKHRLNTSPDGSRPSILSIYWVQQKKA